MIVVSWVAVALLGACGGNNRLTLEELLEQASVKQSEARTLATDTPCTQNNQCSVLLFNSVAQGCQTELTERDYKIYSLVSTTANQAKTAADEYNMLVSHARQLQENAPGTYACPAVALTLPIAACVANKCQKTELQLVTVPNSPFHTDALRQ